MELKKIAEKLLTHRYYQESPVALGDLVAQLKRVMKSKGLSDQELLEGVRIVLADPETYYYPLGAFNSFGFVNQVCALTDTAQEKQAKKWNDTENELSSIRRTMIDCGRRYATDPTYRASVDEHKAKYPDRWVRIVDGQIHYINAGN